MTSVYSAETSSLAFVTPPSSPPSESEDNFYDASGLQTPTQQLDQCSPKQSPASLTITATHITPPLIHRAPTSTVELTMASASGSCSSLTSKKSPVPVQTFPAFAESTEGGATPDDPGTVLEGSLERLLKIAQDLVPSSSISEAKVHPFAHSTAKLELLPSSTQTTAHGIDLEEEAKLYAELMEGNDEDGVYEDMTQDSTCNNTPIGKARFRTLSTPAKPSHGKLSKHKPPLPPLRSSGQSVAGPSSAGPLSNANNHLDLALPYKPYRSSRSSNQIKPSNTFPLPSSSRPPIRSNASYAESVFSADIYLADNTASGVGLGFSSSQSSSSSVHQFDPDLSRSNPNLRSSPYTRGLAGGGLLGRGTPPPLFAQDIKIDGWLVVGEGAEPRTKTLGGGLSFSNSSPSSLSTQVPESPTTDPHHRTPIRLGASQVGSLRQLNTSSVGAYVVYDVVITIRAAASTFSSSAVDGVEDSTADSSGPTTTQMRVLKRYTDFELLREALVGTVGKIGGIEHHLASQIPPLPPKSAWSRFRPAFLEKRRKLLEFWLTRVLLHPEIGGREVVREWVLR